MTDTQHPSMWYALQNGSEVKVFHLTQEKALELHEGGVAIRAHNTQEDANKTAAEWKERLNPGQDS